MRLRVGVYTPKCKLHPFAGTTCIADSMSRYFQSLDKRSKERYVLKLEVAGLTIKEDPYLPERDTEWSSDVRNWPKIEYADILSYFITRPGTFTLKQLTSRRQLEAYNYFQNNHVRTVFSSACNDGKCAVIKAKVNPSQKLPEKLG